MCDLGMSPGIMPIDRFLSSHGEAIFGDAESGWHLWGFTDGRCAACLLALIALCDVGPRKGACVVGSGVGSCVLGFGCDSGVALRELIFECGGWFARGNACCAEWCTRWSTELQRYGRSWRV